MSEATTIRFDRVEPEGLWEPVVGIEANLLLQRKGFQGEAAQKILDENVRVLSLCNPPDATEGTRTGLVIGYVQSGKTLSFTTVAALARDNGYRMVIVLAGTKTNLLDQNEERLTGDLGIFDERGLYWRTLVNPRAVPETIGDVQSVLDRWQRYPGNLERCRTLLIVVMKNATRLANLRDLLTRCNLAGTSALIIDDEGDQAGLNTRVRQNGESPTYSSILNLRRAIPTHTYIQYTATPQAPLLISRIDMLSPQFVELLEPGDGYLGGRDVFVPGAQFVEAIPAAELPDVHNPEDGPPPSLERAMRLFFLGVAAGVLAGRRGNRTMMIHPSQLRTVHDTYATWARSIKEGWEQIFRDTGSPDHAALREEFEDAYRDLSSTAVDLPSFDELWYEIGFAMEDTLVRVVNATGGRIPVFPWSDSYGFILVGGAGLDRGFTVEGLTVTYMPRGQGTGTADTIQQRARFFGYKQGYRGLIRIFVDSAVASAFTAYVTHEESLRASLLQHRGQPMSMWRRLFFLDRSLQPTRRSVMALDVMRGRAKEWVWARAPLEHTLAERNKVAVDSFVSALSNAWQDIEGSAEWTEAQKPRVARRLLLSDVYERLLVPLAVEDEEDAIDHLMVMMQIRDIIDNDPDALCDIYQMSGGARRARAINGQGLIQNIFQGANPGTGYPGDQRIRTRDRVSIQIHSLDLHNAAQEPVASDLRLVAISVPEDLRLDIAAQPED